MKVDPRTLSADAAYFWQIATIVPRPIAWTSTLNEDGSANLAPFSFFTGAAADPPLCIICVSRRKRRQNRVDEAGLRPAESGAGGQGDPSIPYEKKDTWLNIERTGEYVIHVVPEALAAQMNVTSKEHPHGTDEFVAAGLTKIPAEIVKPPRVGEAPVAMECRLERIVEVGRAGTAVIIGEILLWHVRDDVVLQTPAGPRIDPGRLDAIGRMAGAVYTRTRDRFELPRPK